MSYKLSAVLYGHKADVRGLTVTHDNCIISCSRDQTAKLWKPNGLNGGYTESRTYHGLTNFVTSVYAMPPNTAHPNGLVFTGGNDNVILVFEPTSQTAIHSLSGHENTVCRLTNGIEPTSVISASWDRSARLWNFSEPEPKCVLTIKCHEAAVWAVLCLDGKIITGSADKTIKVSNISGSVEKTLEGHDDCVRDLAAFNNNEILSCSNDATVRKWSIETGESLIILYGHHNFVYSISIFGDIASASEDRCCMVWHKQTGEQQSINVPAQNVWTVILLPNSDIVTGSSDGVIRVFSQDSNRQASPKILEAFQNEIASMTQKAEKHLGGIKVSDLPGTECLTEPGTKDAQTRLVCENYEIICYSWSEAEKKWNKMRNVVGGSGGSTETSEKVLYEGKEYDYVLNMDINDDKAPLKLPYNKSEGPWYVAQAFIHKNNLPQGYLERVAYFIIDNSKQSQPVVQVPHPDLGDPFTGSNRYIPGGSTSQTTRGADPSTGSNRCIPMKVTSCAMADDSQNNAVTRHDKSDFAYVDPWKKKPTRLGLVVMEVETVQGDTKESLMLFCSKFGNVTSVVLYPNNSKVFATITFDSPTALNNALQHPVIEKPRSSVPINVNKLDYTKWKSLIPVEKEIFIARLTSSVFKRTEVYGLFRFSKEPKLLSSQIFEDVKNLFEKSCIRIPSEPVIDFLDVILANQESRPSTNEIGDHIFRCDNQLSVGGRSIQPILPIPAAELLPIGSFGNQPIIVTTNVKPRKNATTLIFGPRIQASSTEKEAISSDEEAVSSDDEIHCENLNFKMIRNIRYKMKCLGEPWSSYADAASEMAVENLPKPTNNEDKQILPPGSMGPPYTGKRSHSQRGSSSSESTKSEPESVRMACQLAQISDVADLFDIQVTHDDKLHVDVLIVCTNIELCRYISATFGIIHLDEIVLCFLNRCRTTSQDRLNFTDQQSIDDILDWWKSKTTVNPRKSFRMLQTRYAEYLSKGWNNIAVTCCKLILPCIEANFVTYLGTPDEIMELAIEPYNYAVTVDPQQLFPSSINGLNLIVNHVLGKNVGIPSLIRFRKHYYELNVSSICILPFYVLRALSQDTIRERIQKSVRESIQKSLREIYMNTECLL